MTPHTPSDDPRGYRLDLSDALGGGSAATVAMARARCHTAGVPVPDEWRERVNPLLPSAIPVIVEEVNRWTEAARTLGITQPRLNLLLNGKIDKFSLDALVSMLANAGMKVNLTVKKAA